MSFETDCLVKLSENPDEALEEISRWANNSYENNTLVYDDCLNAYKIFLAILRFYDIPFELPRFSETNKRGWKDNNIRKIVVFFKEISDSLRDPNPVMLDIALANDWVEKIISDYEENPIDNFLVRLKSGSKHLISRKFRSQYKRDELSLDLFGRLPVEILTTWILILKTDHGDKLSEVKLISIIELLRKLSGDSSLKLVDVKSGSIILKLEGSEEGFRVIQDIVESGTLRKILGLPIQYVGYEIPEDEPAATVDSDSKEKTTAEVKLPLKIFISYSRADEDIKQSLERHLALLKREHKAVIWHEQNIEAGIEKYDAIRKEMNASQIILLLVTSDFLASDYHFNEEIQQAMERHYEDTARVIPVIMKPCDWESSLFGGLEPLPGGGMAVTSWANQDEALKDIAKGIRKVVETLAR